MSKRQLTKSENATGSRTVWFRAAETLWPLVLVMTLVGVVLFIPANFAQAHKVCPVSSCNGPELPLFQVHALQRGGISLDTYGFVTTGVQVLFALVYCLVGSLIFLQRPRDRMKLLTAYFLVVFGGVTFPATLQPLAAAHPQLLVPAGLVTLAGAALLTAFLCTFPDGRLVPRWSWIVIPLLPIFQAPNIFLPGSPLSEANAPAAVTLLQFGGTIAVLLGSQIYRYRQVSNHRQRQQTKWVLLGLSVALTGFVTLLVTGAVLGPGAQNSALSILVVGAAFYAFFILIPISIGVAILRSRLWDIDALINRTLVYGLLTVCLGLLYLIGVVGVQSVLRAITGQGSNLAIAISTLAVAALFQPLRRRFQTLIDRRFYRRKYDAARALATFSRSLGDEVDLDALRVRLLAAVEETVQPSHATLWLQENRQR